MATDPLTPEEARRRYPSYFCHHCYGQVPSGVRHVDEVNEYMAGKVPSKAGAEAELLALRSALDIVETNARAYVKENTYEFAYSGVGKHLTDDAVEWLLDEVIFAPLRGGRALSGQAVSPERVHPVGCPVHDPGDAAKADREPAP